MKRLFLTLLVILLLVTLIFGACAKPAPAPAPAPTPAPTPTPTPAPTPVEPVTLRFSTWLAPIHHTVQNVDYPWAKEVEQRTEGRVKVEVYTTEALGKQNDHFEMVMIGITDVAMCSTRLGVETWPLADVFGLRFFITDEYTDTTGTSKAIRRMVYEKYIVPMYLQDAKLLWVCRYSGRELLMADKPIRKLEDVKGLLIGTTGDYNLKAYQMHGAGAENVMPMDTYTALERGMVDGVEWPISFLIGFRLAELVKYVTLLEVGSATHFFAMSRPAWNKLSPADQKIIDELSPKYEEIEYKSWEEEVVLAQETGEKAGIEFITLSPEERKRWLDAEAPLVKEWVDEVNAKGLPGTELYNDIMKMKPK